MKKISIAMITYNHENYIEQAVRSVMMQKGNFEMELIIGNDCSKDNTSKIVNKLTKEFPNNIKFIDRKENMGVINNLLDVLSYCNGDYVAILEGDDYWLTDHKLQDQIEFLENNPNYVLVGSDAFVINQDNEYMTKNNPLVKYHENYYRPRELFKYNFCPTLSILYRNNEKIFEDFKKIWENVDIVADYSLKTYFTTLGNVKILDEKLGAYRYIVKGGSSYSSMGYKGLIKGYNDVIKSLSNLLELKKDYVYKKDIQKEIKRKKIIYMLIYIRFHNFKDLSAYIKRLKKENGFFKTVSYICLVPFEAIRYMLLNSFLKLTAGNERYRNGK